MIHLKHIEHDFLYDQTWIFVIFICQNLWWISEETHPFGFILTHSKSKKSSHALTIWERRQIWTRIEMHAILNLPATVWYVQWIQDWLKELLQGNKCSLKRQFDKTSWKVLSWKVRHEIRENENGKFGPKLESSRGSWKVRAEIGKFELKLESRTEVKLTLHFIEFTH